MNTKYNKWFEETAADPIRRRAAIAEFTKQRIILICCALVSTAVAVSILFTPTRGASSPTFLAFTATMMWFVFFRVDSKRRVLTLLDRFCKDTDEKPAT